jgi:predicted DCC family thiol-disulfide oxidoreductase YuxK
LKNVTDNESCIILFDGECLLCNKLVQFIIGRDPGAKFKFGTLQSESGKSLLKQGRLPEQAPDTVVYIRGELVFLRSDAALEILKDLGGIWKLFRILFVVSRSWRDHLYDYVAKNRYRWFGKRDACMVPAPGDRHRFLTTGNPPASVHP